MDLSERPNRWPWPPIIFGLACIGAIAADQFIGAPTITVLQHAVVRLSGAALILTGLGLDLWAIVTLVRHRTAVLPNRMAETLVVRGPFAYSRNPIYLGNTLVMLGLALAIPAPWFLIFAVLAVITVRKFAIEREEAHLCARFGEAWQSYSKRVRRWF